MTILSTSDAITSQNFNVTFEKFVFRRRRSRSISKRDKKKDRQRKAGRERNRDSERMRECRKRREGRERGREGGRAQWFQADVKASRSQRFPLNLEQTTNSECLLQKAE